MHRSVPKELDVYRIREGDYGSDESYGMAGAFRLFSPKQVPLLVMSSGIDGVTRWEHVSVSCQDRPPTWDEMCFVKDLFWREDETVIQYHPARNDYVNFHPYTLHMWKPMGVNVPLPPTLLIGPKGGVGRWT